jgi:serine/threonine-protein kinase
VEARKVIGRYALYDEIAAGGMATVHLGRLLGPVGFSRTVAIKRLHPHLSRDPEFVAMFLDEARLAARVRHPNVVPTLDVVATKGELFLVMEFVQGESFAKLLRTPEPIPVRIVASVIAGALHGLHAAHEAKDERGEPLGIVHRDMSPHNIFVGVDGVARVLDFGVAKATGRVQTTREGHVKGKLAYMAPEQVYGRTTRQSDIFSISIVLWEALTRERLLVAENEGQTFEKLLLSELPPPSSLAKDVPAGLDAIVMRGLDRDLGRRYATARDMADEIEACVGLASTSQVGAWVEGVAHALIVERSQLVAEIEKATSEAWSANPSLQSTPPPSSANTNEPTLPPPPALPVSFLPTDAPPSRARGVLRALVIAVVVAAIAVGVTVAIRRPTGVAVAAPSTAHTEVLVGADPPTVARPPATSGDTTGADTSADAAVEASPVVVEPPRTTRPKAKPAVECDPPFVLDARGHKKWTEECFKK